MPSAPWKSSPRGSRYVVPVPVWLPGAGRWPFSRRRASREERYWPVCSRLGIGDSPPAHRTSTRCAGAPASTEPDRPFPDARPLSSPDAVFCRPRPLLPACRFRRSSRLDAQQHAPVIHRSCPRVLRRQTPERLFSARTACTGHADTTPTASSRAFKAADWSSSNRYRTASDAASRRECAPSLVRSDWTCVRTVADETPRRSAI